MARECSVSVRKAENGYIVDFTGFEDGRISVDQAKVFLKLQEAIESAMGFMREIAPLVLEGGG